MNGSNAIRRSFLPGTRAWPVAQYAARTRGKLDSTVFASWIDCFDRFSLWFSLPLAIWLSSGWMGLLLQWQALPGIACLQEKASDRKKSLFQRIDFYGGEAACRVANTETR